MVYPPQLQRFSVNLEVPLIPPVKGILGVLFREIRNSHEWRLKTS